MFNKWTNESTDTVSIFFYKSKLLLHYPTNLKVVAMSNSSSYLQRASIAPCITVGAQKMIKINEGNFILKCPKYT